jgi:hypothetical protein
MMHAPAEMDRRCQPCPGRAAVRCYRLRPPFYRREKSRGDVLAGLISSIRIIGFLSLVIEAENACSAAERLPDALEDPEGQLKGQLTDLIFALAKKTPLVEEPSAAERANAEGKTAVEVA